MGSHADNFWSWGSFLKYQDARKAVKMGVSRIRTISGNQVASPSPNQKSRHGGSRPGAGRRPGSRNKQSFELDPCTTALAKAVAGKPAFLFISAMQALEAPLEDVREALGLSRDQFLREYGVYLSETARMRKQGEIAYFAARASEKPRLDAET